MDEVSRGLNIYSSGVEACIAGTMNSTSSEVAAKATQFKIGFRQKRRFGKMTLINKHAQPTQLVTPKG
jgi:hypothetical protein